jgi:signal transduction histidine kinase
MLVVDDDPRSRRLLEGFLVSEGYAVRVAQDGPTALAMVAQQIPDVVLLDVMMPVMTGYEVCKILKSQSETRLCQVMLVTALDSILDKVEGLDTGADDYAAKPVRRDEFLAKVRALVRARRLLQELEQAREALAARNEELQLKKTLAQTLVHDLKNPLAVIIGNLDLLELRGAPESELSIQRSKQGAQRMLKMILNLLDVEALEEGRLTLDAEALDATDLANAAVEEAEVTAQQKKIRLAVDSETAGRIMADRVLMRRVLDNLIANAIVHSPTDGAITIGVRRRDEGVEISVIDEGAGIPEEFRERVFEKYSQAETRKSGLSTNRGLGLTFCRLAVEAHGGSIWVEESEAGGARFLALLPAAEEIDVRMPVEASCPVPS